MTRDRHQVKEVTVFSNGDSTKLSTWSNVPYFFTTTLEKRGIKVNRVDLSPDPKLAEIHRKTVARVLRRLSPGTDRDYFRSLLNHFDLRRRVKRAVAAHPAAQAEVFLTFSASADGLTDKPSVQFCDWTYDHHFNYFLGRKPGFFERMSIRREDTRIEGSRLVFVLFPRVAEHMKRRYRNREIRYIGNVANSLIDLPETELISRKEGGRSLVLVGTSKYVEGANSLIAAFSSLRRRFPDLTLEIIGMNPSDLEIVPDGVRCHGYLSKDVPEQRELYYQLMTGARVFINTTPKWGAFSATLEAMWLHTPVIVTPYDEFVETFGSDIDFGRYCTRNDADLLESEVSRILDDPDYPALCRNARNAAKGHTWDAFMDRFLEKLRGALPD